MNRFLSIVLYFLVFVAIQIFTSMAVGTVWHLFQGESLGEALRSFSNSQLTANSHALLLITALSSLLTIVVFMVARWSPFSREYVRSRPWATLLWVVVMAFGTIIPSLWFAELLGVEMSKEKQLIYEQIMRQPVGYLIIGILAPVAEEMVFRGAILRTLLERFPKSWHWLPIAISALLFGAAHGNMAQFIHATLLGLLLGWLYFRTDSIVPGIALHWANNTIVYVVFHLLPQASDSTLFELLGGNRPVWMALLFSMCIFLPALFQVALRTRK